MFYVTFTYIINFLIYSISVLIIFNLLLCAEMYYVIFSHLIYVLIYILSIFLYNSYSRFYFSC